MSILRKYNPDLSHILSYKLLPFQEYLSYEEVPISILDQKERVFCNKAISFIKVLWQNYSNNEAIWELKSDFILIYPQLFTKW